MLIFKFHKEFAGKDLVYRPRINIKFSTDKASLEIFALIDSGADRTVIPEAFANILKLEKGNKIKTAGIGGSVNGNETQVDLTFTDVNNKKEEIIKVPAYILPDFNDVIIGRKEIFDNFKITFNQKSNQITFEKV